MASTYADRDLLFEALALHLGFVPRGAVDEARKAMMAGGEVASSLAEILIAHAALTADHRAVLDMLVDNLLARHEGNLRRCLDDLSTFGRLRRDLDRRLAGQESHHPTVASISIANPPRTEGEDIALNGDPGPNQVAAAFAADDDDQEQGADYEWSLGAPSAVGNRFQILHLHARGGIGVVSVAFDSELQREVALKQIKTESADDSDSRARFLLEAEVTGRLEHPGVVPVYGLGFDDQGRPYYAMRFVRGVTLEEAIAKFHQADATRGRDARDRVLELRHLLGRFISVCHTMAYAHSRGVLHRDLKPANVLLGPYNETLIVDWGLAKVLGGKQAPYASLVEASASGDDPPEARSRRILPPLGQSSSTDTIAGAAFGTPAFMSPEQAEGQLDRIGPASDVYSLGAVLYTLLCGRPPFEYAWCEVTTLLARVKNGEFPAPRQANHRVQAPLEAICLKAMHREPEKRYASALDLAEEIECWLGDEPVAAYREPRWARLARWGRRHRPLVASAAVLLVTAVAALSLGILLLGRAQRETEAQRRAAVHEKEVATFMSGEATTKAESLRRRDYISRVNLAYREFLDDNAALAEEILYGCPRDLRNWEWSHVHRLGHVELDTFVTGDKAQQSDIWSLAFSPDGRRLVSGSGPWFQAHDGPTGGLVVREVETGREVFAQHGLRGAVQAVAYSPDGKLIAAAVGTTDSVTGAVLTARDAATGQKRWQAEEHGVNILSLAYSPDGQTLATGCGGFNNYAAMGYVRLRDAATGKEKGQIPGGPGGVTSVAYSPDGKLLALANRGLVDVWDLSKNALGFQLRGHLDFVYAVTFSPDGKWIATGGWDQSIRIWDRSTGKHVRTILGHRGFVRGLAFRPDSRQLISCSEDKSLRLWDVTTGRELAAFHGHMGFVHCVAFSPDGARAASGSLDCTIRLWPAAAPDPHVVFRNGSGWVGTMAFSADGRRIATAHNGSVRVWEPQTGEELWCTTAPRGLLGRIALAYSADGAMLVASGPDGAINLWNAETGKLLRELAHTPSPAINAALSPDGSLLAVVCQDGATMLLSMSTGSIVRTIKGHAAGVNAVAISSDGKRLATAGEDQKIKIWEIATGTLLQTLGEHVTGVKGVAFAPDGRSLASVGGQYRGTPVSEVFVWDLASGSITHRLEGHTSLVTAVAYFPDGKRLATASDDRTIKLWDPETGDDVFTLRGHTSGVVSLAISRDGRQIGSGGIDCTARIWSAEPPATHVDQVRRRAAVELVQTLFRNYLLKSKVLEAIRTDPSLNEPSRAAALEIANRESEDAQSLYESAWLTILRPTGQPELIHQALEQIEAACKLVTADPDRLQEYQHTLSLALYRAGRPDEAIQTLDRLNARPSPLDLAVRAMASQQLGRPGAARSALDQLRTVVSARGTDDHEAQGFLHEAENLIRK